MKVEYKKDLRHSYMVIPLENDINSSEYCIKLLEHQRVEGILALERRVIDNQRMLYYEITSKQVMQSLFVKTTLSYGQLRNICENILLILERAYEYLLPEDDFILSPECIYLNIINFEPELCFFPGYQKNIRDQIREVMEYLMNKVDYTDKEAVLLVYQLYAISREESYCFEELKQLLLMDINQEEIEKSNSVHNYEDNMGKRENNNKKETKEPKSGTPDKDNNLKQLEREELEIEKKRSVRQVPAIEEKIEGEKEVTIYPFKTYLYLLGLILGGIAATVLCVASGVLYNSFGDRFDYSKIFAFCLILLCVEGYLIQKILSKNNKITKMVRTQEYMNIGTDSVGKGSNIRLASKQLEKEGRREPVLIKRDILNENVGINYALNHKAIKHKPEIRQSEPKYEKEVRNACETVNEKNCRSSNEAQSYQEKFAHDMVKVHEPGGKLVDDSQDHSYNPTCLLNADLNKPESCILKSLNASYPNITIEHYPFFIGKFRNNVDYCIEKDVISRYHAKVTKEGEEYFLTDLNSTNGTYHNGEMLLTYQKKEIKIGDEITFANLKYQFWKN
jgi:hypothetical protein